MLKKIHLFIGAGLMLLSLAGFSRSVTDMAGRRVEVPEQLNRLIPYDAKTSVLLYPCAGGRMVAKGMLPGTGNLPFLCDGYKELPDVDIKNLEEVMNYRPDIIVAGAFLPGDSPEKFEKLQSRTHIPVVVIDLSLGKLDQSYTFLGDLLRMPDTCRPLVNYLQSVYGKIDRLMQQKTLEGFTVYYTLGADGLMTDPSGSRHTEVLDYLKIPNAAKIPVPSGGHAQVNLEQVIAWNPAYILAATFKGNRNPAEEIKANPAWQTIDAVRNQKVYRIPGQPYGWLDHPPTVNRICGLIWLSELFYGFPPGEAQADIKLFYRLFYQYELKDADLEQMLYLL
jgi:iron complex transport system substrate-binding protein